MAFITSTPLLLQTSCRNEIKYHRRRQFSMSQYQPTLSITRRSLLATFITTATTAIAISSSANAEDQQVELKTVTVGSGPSPVIGDLVGIRFKGSYNGVVFDNLFESTDPYFYRVGTGSVLLVCFVVFLISILLKVIFMFSNKLRIFVLTTPKIYIYICHKYKYRNHPNTFRMSL